MTFESGLKKKVTRFKTALIKTLLMTFGSGLKKKMIRFKGTLR